MFVCSYTQTTFLTQAESENINAQHDGVALPREKEETQKRAATKTGEGDSAPHEHAVAAHAVFDRTRRARPCSYPKGEQYPQQAATKKETLDAKEARKD